jgi:fumarate hydratase class II
MQRLVHPNDDVNRSQSSNDVIPTAMHGRGPRIAWDLLPRLQALRDAPEPEGARVCSHREDRAHASAGRHPLTLGQEFSAMWRR